MTAIVAAGNRLSAPASREPATPATECSPSVDRHGASLPRQAGLPPHGATGAAAIYTTANMAPRSAKGLFARLQNQWKAGETAVHSSLGPIARDSRTQHPVDRLNQISAPRFDGGASVPLPHATSAGLAEAVQQAIGEPAGGGRPACRERKSVRNRRHGGKGSPLGSAGIVHPGDGQGPGERAGRRARHALPASGFPDA